MKLYLTNMVWVIAGKRPEVTTVKVHNSFAICSLEGLSEEDSSCPMNCDD